MRTALSAFVERSHDKAGAGGSAMLPACGFGNWDYAAMNYSDASGLTSLTNAITPGEPQRYFRLQAE